MKCGRCSEEFTDYNKGHNSYCKSCKREYQREWYRKAREDKTQRMATKRSTMLASARKRAKKIGVPFSLSLADIIIPTECPILGILMPNDNSKISYNSPTLDRLIPSKGYVSGNVEVISMRANMIKTNATHEEIQKVADWVKKKTRIF